MNNTDTPVTVVTPEVTDTPDSAAVPAQSAHSTPVLDTLELIRREPGQAPKPDPSDSLLTHRRTSIWDIA